MSLRRSHLAVLAMILVATSASSCGNSGDNSQDTEEPFEAAFQTTPLCPLVPADAESASLGRTAAVFGTDLGFTDQFNGATTILFGDSWLDSSTCPFRTNDDALGTLGMPADDWPGFTTNTELPRDQCLPITFVLDDNSSPSPILLQRWDGAAIALGALNTPVATFHDDTREWGVFIVGGGLPCSMADAQQGNPCPSDVDPQAASLRCAIVNQQPVCIDPTSTQQTDAGRMAQLLYIAERTGPNTYTARALFATNKFLNFTARAVHSFDPSNAPARDYGPGTSALLVWGRPGFDSKGDGGEAPPYFLWLPLPFTFTGERINFAPQYFVGVVDGEPLFDADEARAQPLYTGEFDPVMQAAVSYVTPLQQWIMLYGGSIAAALDADGTQADEPQPSPGAIHARFARDPWGPWSAPRPILTTAAIAPHLVCALDGTPPGCAPPPDPPTRPTCIAAIEPDGGGHLYGVNIIDQLTRQGAPAKGGASVDLFWNVSMWHPYGVFLIKTHIERAPQS